VVVAPGHEHAQRAAEAQAHHGALVASLHTQYTAIITQMSETGMKLKRERGYKIIQMD
jgi:hypothetical protein